MRSLNVYYVDDDMDDILIFSDTIKHIEKNINSQLGLKTFTHGMEMLANIENTDPQNAILFLDINMTGLSGFDVLRTLRSNPLWEKTPIIMYSTSSNPNTIHTSFVMGATGYMVKPHDFAELKKVLTKIFMIDWNDYQRDYNTFLMNF